MATKDELLEQAAELGVDVGDSNTKAEIQDAIDAATPPNDPPDDDADFDSDVPVPESDAEPTSNAPVGYLWVTRKRPIQIMQANPQWEKPTLIDAKSLPELEPQGWRVADGPDADGPSK